MALKRLRHLTALLTILAMLVAACGDGGTSTDGTAATTTTTAPAGDDPAPDPTTEDPAGEAGGTLIVALATEPNSIFLPNSAERNAINVSTQIYEGPIWINDDNEVEPALATEWEVNDDATVFTFTLREGVAFHNGETMDAEDWIASWEAASQDANVYAYLYQKVTSVVALDPMTVEMTLASSDALFGRELSEWAILPASQWESEGLDGIEANPIGTGPFKFISWDRGDRITLEAHEDYWNEGLPLVDGLVFRPIPDSSTRLAAVQTGEVHIAQRFNSEEAATLENAPGVNVVTYPVDRVYYIAFNNLTTGIGTPLESPEVRLAMNHAVDRQAIVDSLFDGQAALSTGLVSTSSLGFDASLAPYEYDPELAMQLLADGGYPDGFTIGFACPTGAYVNFEEVCQAVGGYLEAVGITLDGGEIQFMESGQYWDLEASKQLPPLFGDSWSSTSSESLERLQGALGGFDADYSAWTDDTILGFLSEIQTTIDEAARAAVYSELHRYTYEDPPFIYLYEPFAFEGINEAVQNYKPRAAEDYFLKEVSLAG
ncbi:MAG TPA: ABC transporter substrate-binding protein [Acidimicrobiia bacterium]|nr:ABC transporter substrate-binding protein [Acidimicrobiia bacterium]